jgi:hypothetical protein
MTAIHNKFKQKLDKMNLQDAELDASVKEWFAARDKVVEASSYLDAVFKAASTKHGYAVFDDAISGETVIKQMEGEL